MLTPSEYDHLCDQLITLYDELDRAVIDDMVRRMMRMGKVSDATSWQAKQLQEAGLLYEDIISEIAKHSDASDAQVRTLFEDAGVQSVRNDNHYYTDAGLEGVIRLSDAALQTLNAGYVKCRGELRNLTLTTANTAQTAYLNACDLAYMEVSSGTMDYGTAIRRAVQSAADEGSKVLYPSGHSDRLDVAVRRSVLTGVGQTVRQLSAINAGDMGCDIMEITAHSGARPSHAEWQGKLVSLSGANAGRIIDGVKVLTTNDIGYGTGDGFGGWNCRHDWFPFIEGVSSRVYSDERLAELNSRNIEYNGKMYTEYEIDQMQRALERDIRARKRAVSAADTAVKNAPDEVTAKQMQELFTAESVKLKKSEKKLSTFLDQTGNLPDSTRVWVNGFGRSTAQRAVWANKKGPIRLTTLLNDDTIVDKEAELKKALKLGRLNIKIDESQQSKHAYGKPWKNQVKQAIQSRSNPDPNKHKTPKSVLDPTLDPKKLVDQYGGTGIIVISGDMKTANEFIRLPYVVGRTFDEASGGYISTHTIQIKYTNNGTHVFPTKDVKINGK